MRRYSTSGWLAWAGATLVAAGIAGALGYSYFANRLAPIPQRPLRIGFEPNPPFQIRTENGVGGLAIETVNEAAKRAGVRLEWIETGTSSDEAFQKGLVDLWPLMSDLPERRKRVHFSRPWMINSHVLLLRANSATPKRNFVGHIAIFKVALHVRLLHGEFPQAQAVPYSDAREALQAVCRGSAYAAFLEKRVAMTALKEMPSECGSTAIRVQMLDDVVLKTCVAATFEAAGVADRLRSEIGGMYRDGTLAVIMAKYSFYGLDDTWNTYELMEAAECSKRLAWGVSALAFVLFVVVVLTVSRHRQKQAERVLRESEERFRAIFQQAGAGVAQISLEGKVELANDRYCEVVGHNREDLLGKGTLEITHAKDIREQLAMLPKLLSGEIASFSTDKRYTREDGSIVWAEVCKSLVRDGSGEAKGFIAVVKDITERKQAEAALAESEERFRNLADSAPVAIWLSGPDNRCSFVNKRWLDFTGRTLDQELGQGWIENVHPDDRERVATAYRRSFEVLSECRIEYRARRADGEYRCLLDHGVARFSADGEFAGYVGSCVDITDLKRNFEQHLATQKLESLGVLAAGVAHDFNNLLGAIVARAESATSELAPGSPATYDVEQVRVIALRAGEIVAQLITFARQENAPPAALDLSSVVAEMLDLLRVSIAKAAVLETELASGLPLMQANADEIRQVVMNLVVNASEALEGEPGTITVSTAPASLGGDSGGAVRLEVRDTGSGMTEEVKNRIFDPFFTTRFVGRGLGLASTQGIVRRHGGSIEVESAPGKGSRFTVLLPCAAGQAAPVPHAAELDVPSAETGGTVLFVEDEESLRSVIAKCLRRKNFQVIEAADGAAAIEILKSDPGGIGVVLLDVTLPGISGAELLDELRWIRPEVKVILSTAYSRETAMRGFGGRDVWGFIRKPYRTDDLVNLLRHAAGASNPSGDSSG